MAEVLACLITLPNPDNRTGPDDQEIYLNAREGMLRVLSLLGDDVDERLKDTQEELEEQAQVLLENSGDDEVRWTFVPVMDLNIVP